MTTAPHILDKIRFEQQFIDELPGDPDRSNQVRQVYKSCYSLVNPKSTTAPEMIGWSREVAEELGFSEEQMRHPDFVDVLSGGHLLPTMSPYAMCYGGHQFGSWASQLGDGRAINLGELISRSGRSQTLQLKGAGLTPYSRQGDGLAVVRSSIREFLCSEAMHHLGIPTTRALSVVKTGENVIRDMFYDGHPKAEPGAVVCRVAPSFLRFGNFELHAKRGETQVLKQLADFTIRHYFPELGNPDKTVYLEWFQEICRRTAETIVHWMRVGFVHGVMNTDNMSILGLTIDYGPYGWLEGFDAGWTPNTTDAHGRRYSYGNQPHIGQWNLAQLAGALQPLIGETQPLEDCLNSYNHHFLAGWNRMMSAKLGLSEYDETRDNTLIGELVEILQLEETDMTIFFQTLGELSSREKSNPESDAKTLIEASSYNQAACDTEYRPRLIAWLLNWRNRITNDQLSPDERITKMNGVNPRYVLRNYLTQMAIERAEQGDYSMVEELLEMVRYPYHKRQQMEKFFGRRPEWARNKPGCSMLSCSS